LDDEATGAEFERDSATKTLSLLVKELASESESNNNQAPVLEISLLQALAGIC